MSLWKRLFGRREIEPSVSEWHPPGRREPEVRDWQPLIPTPRPRQKVSIPPPGDYRFIAFDVETANSFPASICQIGLATVDQGGMILTYTTLIDPCTDFDDFNTNLHGISDHTVRGCPAWPEVWRAIEPVLLRQPVVQHSGFDANAVKYACVVNNMEVPPIMWVDSVTIARRAWPDLRSNGGHGLANLRKHLRLSFRHHDAGEDAKAAACVVLEAERHMAMPFTQIIESRSRPKNVTKTGAAGGPFAGQCIAFTGELTIAREVAAEMASRCGFEVKNSVSRKTTYLVVGRQDANIVKDGKNSGKELKAAEINAAGGNIKIIVEEEFNELYRSAIQLQP